MSECFFFRHGGPPSRALHQSGLTMGKGSIHGEPKFIEESKLSTKQQTQGAEKYREGTRGSGGVRCTHEYQGKRSAKG